MIGRDKGTAEDRQVSVPTAIKTGTLWDVSALAGVLPTRDRGLVWFAIINRGGDIENFREQQDRLLNQLIHQWGLRRTPLLLSHRNSHLTQNCSNSARPDAISQIAIALPSTQRNRHLNRCS
uniref:Uncharacterized protein n=1 Tax=Desertifilum tharense IPPAS B-1220 TaxID=1781255 RepID=A0ACD5GWR3_9CYAN